MPSTSTGASTVLPYRRFSSLPSRACSSVMVAVARAAAMRAIPARRAVTATWLARFKMGRGVSYSPSLPLLIPESVVSAGLILDRAGPNVTLAFLGFLSGFLLARSSFTLASCSAFFFFPGDTASHFPLSLVGCVTVAVCPKAATLAAVASCPCLSSSMDCFRSPMKENRDI